MQIDCTTLTTIKMQYILLNIRASVDALCRDGAGEISRDPHTKQLKTRD